MFEFFYLVHLKLKIKSDKELRRGIFREVAGLRSRF